MSRPEGCPACALSVRLKPGELERILAEHFRDADRVDDSVYAVRIASCVSCPDLRYGNTCMHCGCLVEVTARLADRSCPAPMQRW